MSQESAIHDLLRQIERLERGINWLADTFMLVGTILIVALYYVSSRCP